MRTGSVASAAARRGSNTTCAVLSHALFSCFLFCFFVFLLFCFLLQLPKGVRTLSTTCKNHAKPKRKEPEAKVPRLVPPHSRALWVMWFGLEAIVLCSGRNCLSNQFRLCIRNGNMLRPHVGDRKPYRVQTCFSVLGKPICFILWTEGSPIILDPEESIDAQSNWKNRMINVKLPLD